MIWTKNGIRYRYDADTDVVYIYYNDGGRLSGWNAAYFASSGCCHR